MESFMTRLEKVLKEKKLTQTQLAEDLNLRRPTLSDWKKNGSFPPLDIALKIAHYLSVDIEWLATGTTESQPAPELAQLYRDIAELDAEGIDTIKAVIEVQKKYRK